MEFYPDNSIHHYFRTDNDDFKNSGNYHDIFVLFSFTSIYYLYYLSDLGYDRGHLAAAGNHPLTEEDMKRTFVLTNISPQVGVGFNRDIWNVLETYVRYRAKRARNLWACTGNFKIDSLEFFFIYFNCSCRSIIFGETRRKW